MSSTSTFLSGPALSSELDFVTRLARQLAQHPVRIDPQYAPPPEERRRRAPVVQIPLAPTPKASTSQTPAAASSEIRVTIKTLKGASSFPLSIPPTSSIADVKRALASTHAAAPPPEAQRLVLKGKALSDAKLVKDYDIPDGSTIHLVVNIAKLSTTTTTSSSPTPPTTTPAPAAMEIDQPSAASAPRGKSHGKIPSFSLTTEDTPGPGTERTPSPTVPLAIDADPLPKRDESPYHTTISDPAFWVRLKNFLVHEFPNPEDAAQALEQFFLASKTSLTPSEIALIRESADFESMGGILS